MILKTFNVEPETIRVQHICNVVEYQETGTNTVTITVECSDKECDELYDQFKKVNKDGKN